MSPHDLYRQGLLQLLAETMKEYPQGTEKTIHDKLWEKIEDIQSYYLTLYDNWFANNYPTMELIQQSKDDIIVRRKPSPRASVAEKAARKTKSKQMLANLVLHNQILSTGKIMGESTTFDMKRETGYMGGVHKAISKHGTLAQVGKHLEENDLRNIRSRYFKNGHGD